MGLGLGLGLGLYNNEREGGREDPPPPILTKGKTTNRKIEKWKNMKIEK